MASFPYLHCTVSRCVEFVFLSSGFFWVNACAVYAFLTANTVSEPGYGANKKERQTVL